MPDPEITIPKSRGEPVWTAFLSIVVVGFGILAVHNLTNRAAIIPSVLWLFIIASMLRSGCREAGGIRRACGDWLAVFIGRRFASSGSEDTGPPSIRFGYELLGRRFHRKTIPLHRIASLEWSPGQATALAGRDMNDWSVVLWHDHGDPEKSRKHHRLRKPDQDIHIIGPPRPREDTAAFGLDFLSFLRDAGLELLRTESDTVYVRAGSSTNSPNADDGIAHPHAPDP